jgi:hypothetical protein
MNTLRKTLGLSQRPAVESKTPPPSNNGKKRPPAVEADKRVIVTHSCGHKTGIIYLQGSLCAGCQNARRRARTRSWRQDPMKSRLPDGATFSATYDAEAERWVGTLAIDGQVYEAEAGGVFQLMKDLDALYRTRLRRQDE